MLGSWRLLNPGLKFSGSSALEHRGYLYQFGGRSTSGSQVASDCFISSARIREDGDLDPAVVVGAPLEPRGGCWLARHDSYVFMIGGAVSLSSSDLVTRFRLESGGGVSGPVPQSPLPFRTTAQAGYAAPSLDGITYFANMQTGGSGVLGALVAANVTSDGLTNIQVINESPDSPNGWVAGCGLLYGNTMLIVGGGIVGGGQAEDAIWACTVRRFDAGPWRPVSAMPYASAQPAACVINNTLIIAGGSSSGTPVTSVFMAPISKDGGISKFEALNSLAIPSTGGQFVVTKNYLYLVNGTTTANARTQTVQVAEILR